VSEGCKGGLFIGAACLLTAACASVTPLAPSRDRVVDAAVEEASHGGRGLPLPRSTLISRPELPFDLVSLERDKKHIEVLRYRPAGAPPSSVAAIVETMSVDGSASVSFLQLMSPAPDLDVAVLERLYVLAIAQEPRARFCLGDATRRCDHAQGGVSHAEFLHELVRARERAVHAASDVARLAPWHAVSMTAAKPPSGDVDDVAVNVAADERPLAGVSLYFNRAPHSGCVAKSDERGYATCRLVDQHGDAESEPDAGNVPVTVTFPGDVRPGYVLVPSTFMLPVVSR
jgi:hypothetical protein